MNNEIFYLIMAPIVIVLFVWVHHAEKAFDKVKKNAKDKGDI